MRDRKGDEVFYAKWTLLCHFGLFIENRNATIDPVGASLKWIYRTKQQLRQGYVNFFNCRCLFVCFANINNNLLSHESICRWQFVNRNLSWRRWPTGHTFFSWKRYANGLKIQLDIMPWFILFLLLLAVMEAFPREATCSRLPDIYWNSTNPM